MITWMQRHKKWLVVTLWVSVIAFVGAGFVGWGSYDYSKSNSTVAKVGQREVSMNDVQNEYNSLYNQYQSAYKERFNAEVAKKLGLEQIAFERAVQNTKLLSLADEFGLMVTDKEVANNLVNTPQFTKDGKFDKNLYIKALSQSRLNPKDYEQNLKKSLLLSKTAKIFQIDANVNEIELLNSFLNMEDEVEIYIVDSKNINVKYDDTKMKAFWETNKNKYKSLSSYDFDLYSIALIDKSYSEDIKQDFYKNNKNLFRGADGKVMSYEASKNEIVKNLKSKSTKKDALRKYIDLKKGKLKFNSKISYDVSNLPFGSDDIAKIKSSTNGKILKPIKMPDGSYVVLKLLKINSPQVLSYEKAKEMMKDDYSNSYKKEILTQKTKDALEKMENAKLQTTKLGYISRSSIDKLKNIDGLESTDSIEFLNQLFSVTKNDTGIINLQYSSSPKAIVFKITNQKLSSKTIEDSEKQMIKNVINSAKNQLVFSSLIKNLEYRYETQVFMK
jgi:peptidyl-prolyl cis-trans isomerase D